ncbi:hypothetical protein AAVH_43629 [Aphelenchoides avenae]|nr:hypothetical protein AAVH_43629 [Aphelenchus avenae]
MDTYRRSRSQSRFPPPPPEGYHREGFLDQAHRSKSLDNRRDWNRDDDQWYDPPTGGGFGARGGGGGGPGGGNFPRGGKHYDQGEEFFNETVTIPIQKEGAHGGDVAVQRSAAVAAQYEAQGLDNESFSYDRKVHVENDRKVNIYPSRRRQYYEEHHRSGGGGGGYAAGAGYPPPPQGISPRSAGTRYADSEYHYRQQQAQAQQRPLEYTRSAESRFDDQTTVGQREHTGTLGTRSGIGGGGGAAHRR